MTGRFWWFGDFDAASSAGSRFSERPTRLVLANSAAGPASVGPTVRTLAQSGVIAGNLNYAARVSLTIGGLQSPPSLRYSQYQGLRHRGLRRSTDGDTYTLDPDSDAGAAPVQSWSINWGDGSSKTGPDRAQHRPHGQVMFTVPERSRFSFERTRIHPVTGTRAMGQGRIRTTDVARPSPSICWTIY